MKFNFAVLLAVPFVAAVPMRNDDSRIRTKTTMSASPGPSQTFFDDDSSWNFDLSLADLGDHNNIVNKYGSTLGGHSNIVNKYGGTLGSNKVNPYLGGTGRGVESDSESEDSFDFAYEPTQIMGTKNQAESQSAYTKFADDYLANGGDYADLISEEEWLYSKPSALPNSETTGSSLLEGKFQPRASIKKLLISTNPTLTKGTSRMKPTPNAPTNQGRGWGFESEPQSPDAPAGREYFNCGLDFTTECLPELQAYSPDNTNRGVNEGTVNNPHRLSQFLRQNRVPESVEIAEDDNISKITVDPALHSPIRVVASAGRQLKKGVGQIGKNVRVRMRSFVGTLPTNSQTTMARPRPTVIV